MGKASVSDAKPRLSKIWTETEHEIDLLELALRPRVSRQAIVVPQAVAAPVSSVKYLEREDYYLYPWLAKSKNRRLRSTPKVFINLPRLPFGKHRSYNEEKDIRELLVSSRWKAWRRERRVKRRTDLLSSTLY